MVKKIKGAKVKEEKRTRKYTKIIQKPENNINNIIKDNSIYIQAYLDKLVSNINRHDNLTYEYAIMNDSEQMFKKEEQNDDSIVKSIKLVFDTINFHNFDENDEENNEGNLYKDTFDNNQNNNNTNDNSSQNILDFLINMKNLMNNYLSILNNNKDKINMNDEKVTKIINVLENIINLIAKIYDILSQQNVDKNDLISSDDFLESVFHPSSTNKTKYNSFSEELKKEICQAKKVFPSSILSQITFIPKKNANNWMKNGCSRKKGCGKKKILLPLRKQLGEFLMKEKTNNGRKYSRTEIKKLVNLLGQKLINEGTINKYEFDKFTISNSWIKNLLREYNI